MLINTSGIAIRINVSDISITGRSTMGVRLMRTSEEEKIVAIAKISASEEDEELIDVEDTEEVENLDNEIE